MGVVTEADRRIESAKQYTIAAAKDLAAIVVDECWGLNELCPERLEEIQDVMNELLTLKRKLEG